MSDVVHLHLNDARKGRSPRGMRTPSVRSHKIACMRRHVLATAIAVAACGIAADAHHSLSGYDATRPVTIDGVITAFHFVNPHPFVEVDARDPAGVMQRWRLELDNRSELMAAGMSAASLQPGDRIAATGSSARDGSKSMYVGRLERRTDGFLYEQIGTSPRVRLPR